MSLDIKLGSYSFGNYIDKFEVSQETRTEPIAIPRREGFISDTGYKSGMVIRIGGLIYNDDSDDTRTAFNLLKNAFSVGKVALTIYDDRQVTVQKTYFSSSYEESDLRRIRWEAELVSDDFGFVAVSETESETTISASPATATVTNSGNLESSPVIRLTAGSSDIASGLQIDNDTQSKSFTYNAAISSGDWVEIDIDNLTVEDQDGVNKLANFSGDFFKLSAGGNLIRWTGTATGSPKIKFTYRSKYDGL